MIDLNIQELRQSTAEILAPIINDNNVPVFINEQDNQTFSNWITFKFKDWLQDGQEVSRYLTQGNTSTDYETRAFYTVNLQVTAIGNNSEQQALTLSHFFTTQSARVQFSDLGLAYMSKTQVRPSPRIVDSGWEQRHSFDVKFLVRIASIEQLDYILSVEIENEIQDDSGNTLFTETVEINL